jgi:hypothetical protein
MTRAADNREEREAQADRILGRAMRQAQSAFLHSSTASPNNRATDEISLNRFRRRCQASADSARAPLPEPRHYSLCSVADLACCYR